MATKHGTAGNDLIDGTSSGDSIYGLGGNDILRGLGGGDGLYGDAGADRIWGGTGNDALFGGDGADQLYGEAGDDYLDGGAGDDWIVGGSGKDRLRGGDGNDTLNGGAGGTGDDDVNGGGGNDTLIYEGPTSGLVHSGSSMFNGGAGTDALTIKAGSTLIATSDGARSATVTFSVDYNGTSGTVGFNDRADGGTGSGVGVDVARFSGIEKFGVAPDTRIDFFGGDLDATVTGGNGSDRFFGGFGNETFNGGGGHDTFFFRLADGDVDHINGFNAAEDVIVTNLWEDSQGTEIAHRSITESNGHTTVTTTTFGGELLHTLIIDQVGIPLDVFRSDFDFV